MAIKDEDLERLRTKTVEFILCVRAEYLRAGASPLKHWDQIQNRMLSAARRSTSADEWATTLCRGLQLPALNSASSKALIDLGATVRELGGAAEWLDMVQREYGLLMAMARLSADERRAAREEKEAI